MGACWTNLQKNCALACASSDTHEGKIEAVTNKHEADFQLAQADLAAVNKAMAVALNSKDQALWTTLEAKRVKLAAVVKRSGVALELHRNRKEQTEREQMLRDEGEAAKSAVELDRRLGLTEDNLRESADSVAESHGRLLDRGNVLADHHAETAKLAESLRSSSAEEVEDDARSNDLLAKWKEALEARMAEQVDQINVPADRVGHANAIQRPKASVYVPLVPLDRPRDPGLCDALAPNFSAAAANFVVRGSPSMTRQQVQRVTG